MRSTSSYEGGGSVALATQSTSDPARSDPITPPIQTITDSADLVIHPTSKRLHLIKTSPREIDT